MRPSTLALLLAALALTALLAVTLWFVRLELPPQALDPCSMASLRLVSRDGVLLRDVLARPDGRNQWVPLARISPHLVQATLASEDQRFFSHHGVDGRALLRALLLDAAAGRIVSGGSTLTMQLVRLLEARPRGLRAKLSEIVLAWKLERRLDKQQILWQYLNRAPYGGGALGIEAAAQRYLNKPAAELSLADAALLAALPRSPQGYAPVRHRARLLERQRYILRQMWLQRRITRQQLAMALRQPIAWEAAARPFLAPHFTARVLADPLTRRAAWVGTTLALPVQQLVETAARESIARLRKHGVSNAAVLVVDNAASEVLAYVGSAQFSNAEDSGQIDGTLARRQPGSTMKPFTYALALEQGLTPATLLEDLPAHFATEQGDYAPRNYDDTFHGPVRLRVALASSYNVPAVRVAEQLGLERLLSRLRAMGFASLDQPAPYYGLGLTLGNGEVTLQELVAAYAMLARGGQYLPLRLIREVRTVDGQRVVPTRPRPRRIFSRQVSYLIGHILADPLARVPAFGRETPLDLGFPAAVKTGTSKDFRDNWTVGYSARFTVGVWVGNFDGSSMHRVSGISGAAPLWANVMQALHPEPGEELAAPAGLVQQRICPLSGLLAGPHCEVSTEEVFVAGSEPAGSCSFHQVLAIDRRDGLLAGPGCPSAQVTHQAAVVLPPRYRAWAFTQGWPAPPSRYSPACPAASSTATVRIRFPVNGDRYFLDPDLQRTFQRLPLQATVEGEAAEVRWLVDGQLVARAPYPYSAHWAIHGGQHTIVAVLPTGQRSSPVTISIR